MVNTFRVAVQNINGMKLGTIHLGAEEIDAMENLGIDLLGLVKTNIKWTIDVKATLDAMIRMQFGHGRSVTASGRTDSSGYLPGGTAMVACGKVSGRVIKRVSDDLGRFTYMTLHSKDGRGIIVITAYVVCQKKGAKAGPYTSYM